MDPLEVQQVPGAGDAAAATGFIDAGMLIWIGFLQFKIAVDLGALSSLQCDFGQSTNPECVLPDNFPALFFIFAIAFYPWIAFLTGKMHELTVLFKALWVWILANFIAGFIGESHIMWWSRILVAYGGAAFITIAIPLINDIAPATAKARWMAVLPIALTAGGVAGFIYGRQADDDLPWLFRVEAFIMVPLSLLCFFPIFRLRLASIAAAKAAEEAAESSEGASKAAGGFMSNPLSLSSAKDMATSLKDAAEGATKTTGEYVQEMFANGAYVCTLLGNLTFYLSLGAFGMFIEEFLTANFDAPKEDAWITTGALFLVAGLAGPLIAGIVLDYKTGSLKENEGTPVSNLAASSAKAAAFGAFVCGVCAVWTPDYSIALVLFALSSILAFGCLVFVPIALVNIVDSKIKHWSVAFGYAACSLFQAALALWLVRCVRDAHGFEYGFTAGLSGFLLSGIFWSFAQTKEPEA